MKSCVPLEKYFDYIVCRKSSCTLYLQFFLMVEQSSCLSFITFNDFDVPLSASMVQLLNLNVHVAGVLDRPNCVMLL